MGIWSDFFDPFSSLQSDKTRQARADARARGRAAYQASANAVRDGVNQVKEAGMGPASEPDLELEQARRDIEDFRRKNGFMFWRDKAWEQGIGIERAYGNYHDKRGFPFGWGNLPQEEKDKLQSDYEKSQRFWRSRDYPAYHEKFWAGVAYRQEHGYREQTQQTVDDIARWREGIEAEYVDVQHGFAELDRREKAETDKDKLRELQRERIDHIRDSKMVNSAREMVAEDYARALDGFDREQEKAARKEAEKQREAARAVEGPAELRRIRTEIAHRTRDMMIIHNDELKDMNDRLHAQGIRACVLGGMPNRTRIVFEDRVTLKDKVDAKINCQDLDFGD